jgi:hypothetical protein
MQALQASFLRSDDSWIVYGLVGLPLEFFILGMIFLILALTFAHLNLFFLAASSLPVVNRDLPNYSAITDCNNVFDLSFVDF